MVIEIMFSFVCICVCAVTIENSRKLLKEAQNKLLSCDCMISNYVYDK